MRSRNRRNVNGVKREAQFSSRMRRKLATLFFIVLLAFVGLTIRLFMISSENEEEYKKQILSQQSYFSTTLPFKRGDILDANGVKMATSEKVYNLILDSKYLLSEEGYMDYALSALSQCFPDFKMEEARKYANDNPTSRYFVSLKQLSYDEVGKFVDLKAKRAEELKKGQKDKDKDSKDSKAPNAKLLESFKGIWFEEEYKRIYPGGSLACDALGFTGKDNAGNLGLEGFYNDILNGSNGREYGYMNDDNNFERTTIAATDGYNIVSTIDSNIQAIVERKLEEYQEANKNAARTGNGARNVGCIMMDVNSGEILAMAGYPKFDLNDTRNTDALIGSLLYNEEGKLDAEGRVITEENKDELLENEDVLFQNLNHLWKNYCIQDTYEPGSTAKPFTVAAGLESGKMTGNEYYTCNGSLHVGDHDIRCHNYKKGGDGTLSVQQSIEQSCNVALMLMGKQIGKSVFLEYQQKFNFGLKTNIDLEGEARTDSLVFTDKTMGPTELATSTFGQGYNVTMIQMISAFCSLINGGYYYEPHMVSQITAADGSVVKNISPRVLKQTVSADTSQKIVEYCNGVVVNGTGKTARPAGYAIGGKTGTAETVPRDKRNYVVSFMGYAPADNPKIAIYVVVDRPNAVFQDDAKHATRIVRSVLTEVLPYMNIYMTEELSDKEREEVENLEISINKDNLDENAEEGDAEDGNAEDGNAEEGNDQDKDGDKKKDKEDQKEGEEAESIDANGGDTTSSTSLTEAEKADDNANTAPLSDNLKLPSDEIAEKKDNTDEDKKNREKDS